MKLTFKITVEVNRTRGKFASHDDVTDALRDALDSANPGDLSVGDDSELEVTEWEVEEL